jgi:hypothetical protein
VSAWVNEAFRRQVDHDRRTVAMDEYLAAYESEFGEISAAEIVEATKRSRATAKIVRSGPVARTHKKRSA